MGQHEQRRDDEELAVRKAAADELIRGHGLAGRALFNFADRLQRLENRLLLSGDGALTRALPVSYTHLVRWSQNGYRPEPEGLL